MEKNVHEAVDPDHTEDVATSVRKRALGIIRGRVDLSMAGEVATIKDPLEALEHLASLFNRRTGCNLMAKSKEHSNFKMEPEETVGQMIFRHSMLLAELETLQGSTVPEHVKCVAFLNALPNDEWGKFKDPYETEDIHGTGDAESKYKYANILTAARNYETKVKNARKELEAHQQALLVQQLIAEQAMYANGGRGGRGSQRGRGRGGNRQSGGNRTKDCFNCGLSNHLFADCTKPKKCRMCGRPDHFAKDCSRQRSGEAALVALVDTENDDDMPGLTDPSDDEDDTEPEYAQYMEEFAWLACHMGQLGLYLIADSGSTIHLVNSLKLIVDAKPTLEWITGIGGVKIKATLVGKLRGFPGKCLYAEGAHANLLSVVQVAKAGWDTTFSKEGVTLVAPDGRTIFGKFDADGKLNRIDEWCYMATEEELGAQDMLKYHYQIGHAGVKAMRNRAKKETHDTSKWPKKLPHCKACATANTTRAPISRQADNREADSLLQPGQRIDWDLAGPMPKSISGYVHALQGADRATRYKFTGFLKTKDEAPYKACELVTTHLAPFRRFVKIMHADQAGELKGKEWQDMCRDIGAETKYSAPYTPELNGLAEVTHRDTFKKARAMLAAAPWLAPDKFWAEALNYATYQHNTTPDSAGETPFKRWFGSDPPRHETFIWGSPTTFYVPGEGKFGMRGGKGYYLGPCLKSVGGATRIYNTATKRIVISRSFMVDETAILPFLDPLGVAGQAEPAQQAAQAKQVRIIEPDSDSEDEGFGEAHTQAAPVAAPAKVQAPTAQPAAPPAPAEVPAQEDRLAAHAAPPANAQALRDIKVAAAKKKLAVPDHWTPATPRRRPATTQDEEELGGELVMLAIDSDPTTYKRAMERDDATQWQEAAKAELHSLLDQDVFGIELLDSKTIPFDGKWVFKTKRNEHNVIYRHKARFVFCGNRQVYGRDYDETSAPVAMRDSIRALAAVAAAKGWVAEQVDFVCAYLNAPIDELIYMRPPPGLLELCADRLSTADRAILESGKGVLRLKKALYGLKQAGRLWYETVRAKLIELGFKPTETDPCVFVGNGIIFPLYVDDGMLYAEDHTTIDALLVKLGATFDINRLGAPRHFLGWRISTGPDGIKIDQGHYVEALNEAYGNGARPKATPMVHGAALPNNGPPGNKALFQEIIGSLNYLATGTRPDISTAVSMLAGNSQNPTRAHETAAHNVINYLNSTDSLGIHYKPSKDGKIRMDVYCDASFGPDEDSRKSRSGYVILINGRPVAWKSQLQKIIAHSTSEAEYVAMSEALREAVALKQLLGEAGIEVESPTVVFEDNQTAKHMAEQITTKRAKHIDIKYHHVRELVQSGEYTIIDCRTEDMVADILTKPLPKPQFIKLRAMLMAEV